MPNAALSLVAGSVFVTAVLFWVVLRDIRRERERVTRERPATYRLVLWRTDDR